MKIDCAFDKMISVDELTPHKDNPNKHPDKQIELLAKIIKYQGFRHSIVVSNRSGFIVSGHGRLMAAKLLGMSIVPVDYQDFESEAQEYAHLIADNKIAELAEHDNGLMVDKILADFPDLDTELLGLDEFNLHKIEGVNAADENAEWANMPDFEKGDTEVKIIMYFKTELERELYAKSNNIVQSRTQNGQWIVHI